MHPIAEIMLRFDGPGFRSGEDRERAIEELHQLGAELLQYLVQALHSSDAFTRQHAATATIMTFGSEGQSLILPLLQDTDTNVRWHACGLLYDFGNADAIPALVERLRADSEVSVRVFAVDALCRIAGRGIVIPDFAVAALEEAAKTDHGYSALGHCPGEQAQQTLAMIRGDIWQR